MNGKKAQYTDPVVIGDVMRAATVGIIAESKNEEWPVGKRVFGFGGICIFYFGIPGGNLVEVYACESDEEIPATFELTYGGVIIGIDGLAWRQQDY